MLIKESLNGPKQLWSFEVKPVDPLIEDDDDDEDEGQGLSDEKAPRKIGDFIKHEDFTENGLIENEEAKDQYQNLTKIEEVFMMDHDFVCIQR